MRLTSRDGAGVELRPTRYQFPHEPTDPRDHDANWLEIRGEVRTAAGESWSFEDPCLTTWETRALRDWLRAAAEGGVPVTEAPHETSSGLLMFLEPNLGFSVADRGDDGLVIRVHLSLESAGGRPGAGDDAASGIYAYSVPLRVSREDVLAAVAVWEDELAPFPER